MKPLVSLSDIAHIDRQKMEEVPTRIEPCLIEESIPPVLASLVDDIRTAAAQLEHGYPTAIVAELANVIRVANSVHSNLIEGHKVDPISVDMALFDGIADPLIIEAAAHVSVQQEVDSLLLEGDLPVPTSLDFVRHLHCSLYQRMPPEFAFVTTPAGENVAIRPGEFRTRGDCEVAVGRHQPPSSFRISAFMEHFSRRYKAVDVTSPNYISAIAAAHHRFNYIHPFPDGNGRVSRLMSHAMALRSGIGGSGLWSISRGLYLGLRDRNEYKRLMDYADHPRMGDRDGRGNLSLKALTTFSEWFLSTILEQIRFSGALLAPRALDDRYSSLVSSLVSDPLAPNVTSSLLAGKCIDAPPGLIDELVAKRFVAYSNGGVRILFPIEHHKVLFPDLFAEG
jgi:Fic family protein